ncbi:hypothetical protein HYS47_04050 [Candidatus Woesearchaeota archaeon]|nr:hypothetical protein [Candidatus Woesearchaeota archaeon]
MQLHIKKRGVLFQGLFLVLILGGSVLLNGCGPIPFDIVQKVIIQPQDDSGSSPDQPSLIRKPLPQQQEVEQKGSSSNGGNGASSGSPPPEAPVLTTPTVPSVNSENEPDSRYSWPGVPSSASLPDPALSGTEGPAPTAVNRQPQVQPPPRAPPPLTVSGTSGTTSPTTTTPSTEPTMAVSTYDNYPITSSKVSPSNPDVGELFEVTINAEDVEGLRLLSWQSSKPLSAGSSGSFNCSGQKKCSHTWMLSALESGTQQLTLSVTDTSTRSPWSIPIELNVYPARTTTSYPTSPSYQNTGTTSPSTSTYTPGSAGSISRTSNTTSGTTTGTTTGTTSGTTSTSQTGSTSTSPGSCSTRYDCRTGQICRSGRCVDVECTSSSQCGTCQRCSDYQCRSCGYGPYGCYC